jgi:tetratricopeptide (TPR) repeat protein
MLLHTLHSRPRAGLKAFARSLVSDDEAAEELAARMSGRLDAPTTARLYEAFLQADALTVADNVEARTLLAFGVHDRMVVEEEARELQSHFVSAQIGMVEGTPGTPEAVREAWIQIRDFLTLSGPTDTGIDVAPVRRVELQPTPPKQSEAGIGDYVPTGPPPISFPRVVAAPTPAVARHTPSLVWGPPPEIPREAIDLNRLAIDRILLGEIEEALTLFQQAVEIAPAYEDAQVNYRELLSRLVQRRVAQWQNEQADMAVAEAKRRAERYAKRTRKSRLPRMLRPKQGAA